ncbi:hypothetical protein RHGRI_032268 [Rhododendron griersonianum]|uniref:Uncharacterized protein n=1 Tax=Rhododendron griersonianum TaxID=479676 RepID=A0AAV6IDJ0_9ERIC|nr:hypothetical protein RHGRI_032268 [Rhododendron griersonianum]
MAGGQHTPQILHMIRSGVTGILAYTATIPAWKSLLFFGTGVLSLEGTEALKEWQGNWRENRRDPAAYLDRKISYLALELKVTEMGLKRYGKENKKA